jgi:putative nucleic acid modification protein with dual OB domain
MPTEEIIVLASSKKHGGRCVAGISTSSGEWVRPVSGLGEGELYPFHCRVDGRLPAPLDIVEFGYERRLDDSIQPENVPIADEPWRLTGILDPDAAYEELRAGLVSGPELFGNCEREVDEETAREGIPSSLALVEPEELRFAVNPPYRSGPFKPRAAFALAGQDYDLPVTDMEIRPRLMKAGLGGHAQADVGLDPENRTLMTISLGTPKFGACWKLAAAFLSVR